MILVGNRRMGTMYFTTVAMACKKVKVCPLATLPWSRTVSFDHSCLIPKPAQEMMLRVSE